MKKILLLIVLLIVAYLLYNYVSIVGHTVDKILVPSTYEEYPYLYENKVEGKEYQITKILNGSAYEAVRFHSGTKQFIIEIPDADYHKNEMGWKTLWKVDKDGKIVDSLRTTDYMQKFGLFLGSKTYIDWLHSGDKKPKKYKRIINYDSIPKEEFISFTDKAETIAFANDYENKKTNCYLKIANDWWVFESIEAFKSNFYSNEKSFFKREPKSNDSLITLKNRIIPWQEWENDREFIHLQRFVRKSRNFKSFLDLNNTSRSGWNGTGYFRLTYNKNDLLFKGTIFKGHSFHTDMSMYDLGNTPVRTLKDIDIAFILVTKNRKSRADPKEEGVFLISKK